mmetsp:Transcript_47095/g.131386  ORF Transcript_47095/g.131386 Transcript_47095/m.131386 type:complete len:103 (-) Transcript_47095:334-642(-)
MWLGVAAICNLDRGTAHGELRTLRRGAPPEQVTPLHVQILKCLYDIFSADLFFAIVVHLWIFGRHGVLDFRPSSVVQFFHRTRRRRHCEHTSRSMAASHTRW